MDVFHLAARKKRNQNRITGFNLEFFVWGGESKLS